MNCYSIQINSGPTAYVMARHVKEVLKTLDDQRGDMRRVVIQYVGPQHNYTRTDPTDQQTTGGR